MDTTISSSSGSQPAPQESQTANPSLAKVRVAVVGCGAVAKQFHIPLLAGHEHVELVAFVDRDAARVEELGQQYQVPVLADAGQLRSEHVDAAILATPPAHHAPGSIDLARRGIHIFVEKPMALNARDANEMTRAADEAGVVLSVGLFRRLLPTTRLMRAVVESGLLGEPLGFDVDEGSVYGWEAATLGNMRKELAGGGVLIDVGSHAIDRLLAMLPGRLELRDYRHNAHGGIESDCQLKLDIVQDGRTVPGSIQLSRTRRLRNTVQIRCEKGTLEVPAGERFQINIHPQDVSLRDEVLRQVRQFELRLGWADEPKSDWWEIFRCELDDWLDAIRHGTRPQLNGASAIPTVELIDECYARAGRLHEPGIDERLFSIDEVRDPNARVANVGNSVDAGASKQVRVSEQRSVITEGEKPRRRRSVLITGATGFIGCRVAEILSLREGWDVRAAVHTPANASRLARLPVELVMADLRSVEDVRRIMAGIDTVIHCAIAPPWAPRTETRQVTVGGTGNLADAALKSGIDRFIHLSSFGIHGNDVTGVIDESTKVRPPRGDRYCESKAESERIVLKHARRGLPAVVLRPTNVYGPYCKTFVTRPIEYLLRGRFVLSGSAEMPSNTVHVDNLVEAIIRSAEAPMDICGQVFLISDGDDYTWGQFFRYFADAIGAELQYAPAPDRVNKRNWPGQAAVEWTSSWGRATQKVVMSAEFKALGLKVLNTDPIGRYPRELLQRSPRLRRWVSRQLGMNQAAVYRRLGPEASDVFYFGSRPAVASVEKAKQLLHYGPPISRQVGMQRTLEWLRYAKLV